MTATKVWGMKNVVPADGTGQTIVLIDEAMQEHQEEVGQDWFDQASLEDATKPVTFPSGRSYILNSEQISILRKLGCR